MSLLVAENASRSSGASLSPSTPEVVDEKGSSLGTSVGKALALLDALGSGSLSLGVSELARRADLPKSTAFRLLACLAEAGFVDRLGSEYCLGRRLFELGSQISYCRPRGLRDVALPFLMRLAISASVSVVPASFGPLPAVRPPLLWHQPQVPAKSLFTSSWPLSSFAFTGGAAPVGGCA